MRLSLIQSLGFGFFLLLICSVRGAEPQQRINLLDDFDFDSFVTHLDPKRSLTTNPRQVWNYDSSQKLLHVTGKGWGYLRTKQQYRDYHLVLEYKWGERTYIHREDRARDGGLMVHGYGPDGAFGNMFLSSFQAQLLGGASGDLIALASRDESGKPAPTTMQARATMDRDGEPVWNPGGETIQLPRENSIAGRLNWRQRDPDWVDRRAFRGANDIENPPGEWNRLEVICRNDTIEIILNGEPVNKAFSVSPSQGYVCIQSEAAEWWVRRWELWPLDQFDETWRAEQRSTDTGYRTDGESLLPRRLPLDVEQSKALWKIPDEYEIQLVASEPLVNDPVDLVWDAAGNLYVAEMRDYPLPSENGEFLSRIRMLQDEDGDGIMDKATNWATNLDHVQGLLPMRDGLVATTRNAILFLRDTDGDGVADEQKKLFQQNDPRHNQLQISSPRWGLDNAIYFNNGLDLKEIYPAESPDDKIDAKSKNLRFDPYNNVLTTVSGRGQFGGSLDNWNRRFFSTNRNPIIFAVFPQQYAGRNPFAGISQLQADIDPPGAKLRPVRLSHTTSVAHAGTYTAACGLAVYRGGLMPGMLGDVLVCDPTAQLVTRNRLSADGASFSSERVLNDGYEFLVSGDDWTRPVNLRNGPDGALYVCDMYRRFIDHSRFFPEEFSQTNYMRAGFDHGRIWRIVPRGFQPEKIEPLPDRPEELAALLAHENSWQRIHAQRLLMEKAHTGGISTNRSADLPPEAAAHQFWLLNGQGQPVDDFLVECLTSGHPGLAEAVIPLADIERHRPELLAIAAQAPARSSFLAILKLGDLDEEPVTELFANLMLNPEVQRDPWTRKAILSGSETRAGKILTTVMDAIRNGTLDGKQASTRAVIKEFAQTVATRGNIEEMARALTTFNQSDQDYSAWRFSFAEGIDAGLRKSKLKQRSLAALLANPPEQLQPHLEQLSDQVDRSLEIAADRGLNPEDRIAAIPLASQKGQEVFFGLVEKLIDQVEPVEIQKAACQAMTRFKREVVADFFFERWDDLAPTPRREALTLIATNPRTAIVLMKKMKAGEIPASIMPPMQRWSYGRSSNQELKTLANELFGKTENDRSSVVERYRKSMASLTGDPERGKQVFQKATCATCHRKGGLGVEVGPPLDDVRIKPDIALLTDILDPNRAVEERWASYQIETDEGANYMGLIASETSDFLELRMPGGHSESINRGNIRKTNSAGLSLMPAGLEGAISNQEMADLLAFLKQ